MFYREIGIYSIPLLEHGEVCTDDYCALLAKAIGSDGCTLVSELYHECCVVHDLGYEFGIDPWGVEVTKREIDAAFREGMERRSKLGRFSPVAWSRWAAVAAFGRWFRRRKA